MAGGAGVCGLTWNSLSMNEGKWVGRGKKVVLGKEMEKGVVTVVVDAKVNQELVVWRVGVKKERVEPRGEIWFLETAGV